eukprot:PLAT7812.1.p2 GENE.PLAT7812.1~~PLAT7812.1.p2  ORF type:complete len:125 (-),score=43.54 PLAT7812.1:855-1229(-)
MIRAASTLRLARAPLAAAAAPVARLPSLLDSLQVDSVVAAKVEVGGVREAGDYRPKRTKYKLKTRKGIAKRFRLTGKGLLKRWKAGRRHHANQKNRKRVRNLGKHTYLEAPFNRHIKRQLKPYY